MKRFLILFITAIVIFVCFLGLTSCGSCNHSPGEIVRENEIAATCTEKGSYDSVIYCKHCGKQLSRTTKEIEMTEHSPSDAVKMNIQSATCSTKGHYDEVVYCEDCNRTISRTKIEIPLEEHHLIGTEYSVEACGVSGTYMVQYCVECKTIVCPQQNTVIHAHSYVRKSNDLGVIWFECSKCGNKVTDENFLEAIAGANNHSYRVYDITEPTCEEYGMYILACTECGYTTRQHISPLGHAWNEGTAIKEPTCLKSGEINYQCLRCSAEKKEYPDELGHDWDDGKIIDESESCVDEGTKLFTCKRCPTTDERSYFAPHDYSDWECIQKENCTQIGIYKRICGICYGEDFNYKAELHQWDAGVTTKEPTCEENGVKKFTCGSCGETKTEPIEKLGHDWKTIESKEPTCTKDGYTIRFCLRCGERNYDPHQRLGHNLSYEYDGDYHWEACTRCDYKTRESAHFLEIHVYTEEIDDGAQTVYVHILKTECTVCEFEILHGTSSTHVHYGTEIIETKLPTCTEAGYLPGLKCSVEGCDEILIEPKYQESYGGHLYEDCNCLRCGETLLEMELSQDGEYYIVKGIGAYTGTILNIPITYKGLPVEEIAECAFKDCTSITSITIPAFIKRIGEEAFRNCSSLEDIYFEAIAMEDIAERSWTFYNGNNVSLLIGKNVSRIPAYLFYNFIALVEVEFEKNSVCNEIGYSAFEYCSSLAGVYITDIAKWCTINFGNSASNPLYYANNLYINENLVTELVIPDGVVSIGDRAFYGYTSLKSVTFGDNSQLESIGECSFEGCSNLTSITIPDSVTSIGESAFYCCTSLTSITIHSSIINIGSYTFSNCYKLVEIINKSSLSITAGSSAYGYVAYYAKEVHKGESKIVNRNNYLFYTYDNINYLLGHVGNDAELTLPEDYNGEKYEIYQYAFYDHDDIKSVTIPDSITSIGSFAFCHCSSLTSITIPDSVASIGEDAFYSCDRLTSITIPDSVTSIGNSAFYGCTSLESVTFGDNSQLKSIGASAFGICRKLTSITIPDSVTSIGNSAFYYCTSLNCNEYDNAYYLGNNTNPYVALIKVKNSDIASCTIHSNAKFICSSAFEDCSSLTNITIPDSVTSINYGAFKDCTSLTGITIPDSVTSIGESAFKGCTSLTSITLPFVGATKDETENTHFGYIFGASSYSNNSSYVPSSLKTVIITGGSSIGEYAFYNCESLTCITIPDSITSIDFSAFENCSSLNCNEYDNAYYLGNKTNPYVALIKVKNSDIASCTIHSNAKFICSSAFEGCSSLKSITIPDGVTSIGSYAFRNCTNLASITFGDNSQLESIDTMAFYGCTSLANITIPDSVTNIGYSAFRNCTNLASITFGGNSQLKSIDYSAFSDCRNLLSITFSDNSQLESIGNGAFSGCSSLTSITIPDSVTSIGWGAFNGCTSLTSVTFVDTEGWWYTTLPTATSGTSLSSTSLEDTSTAATYLTSTYCDYYWRKS